MKIFSTAFICLFLVGCMTTQPTGDQPKRIIDVKQFAGMKKKQLYQKSLLWAGKSFGKANEVIQYKDQSAGKIVCQGIGCIDVALSPYDNCFSYTLTVSVKDGKIRTCFENLASRVTTQGGTQVSGAAFDYQWDEIISTIKNIRTSLYSDIKMETKEENW